MSQQRRPHGAGICKSYTAHQQGFSRGGAAQAAPRPARLEARPPPPAPAAATPGPPPPLPMRAATMLLRPVSQAVQLP